MDGPISRLRQDHHYDVEMYSVLPETEYITDQLPRSYLVSVVGNHQSSPRPNQF